MRRRSDDVNYGRKGDFDVAKPKSVAEMQRSFCVLKSGIIPIKERIYKNF